MLASQSQSLDNYHNWQTSLYMNVKQPIVFSGTYSQSVCLYRGIRPGRI